MRHSHFPSWHLVAGRRNTRQARDEEVFGVSHGQLGPPGGTDQQRVTGEDPVVAHQAHRVRGVARRVQYLQPQLAEHESDAQRIARRQRQLAVGLADLRIDQRPGASVRAPNRYDWQAPAATCSKIMTAA